MEWIHQWNILNNWHILYWLNVMTGLIITSPSLLTSCHFLVSSWLVIWTSSMKHVDALVYHTWTWKRYLCQLSTTVWHPLICGWIQTRLNDFIIYWIVYHKWRGYIRVLPSKIILSHTLLMHWNVVYQGCKWKMTMLMKVMQQIPTRKMFQMILTVPD